MACKTEFTIDLHIHSTASDGTLSPGEILKMAEGLGLAAISITDHDTVAGVKEALELGIPKSLRFVNGIEISANAPSNYPCSGSFHILGYGIGPDDKPLNETLSRLQKARKDRNPMILHKLGKMGLEVSMEELLDLAGAGQAGRPHIARLMVEKGYVSSINEAFDNYLGRGESAYVNKYRVECAQAIETIIGAGGVPVLAHPVLLKPLTDEPMESLIRILKDFGLMGIEVHYPEHTPSHMKKYTEIAQKYDLLMTGGTDFHGSLKPSIKMGTGKGNLSIPYDLYEKLIRR